MNAFVPKAAIVGLFSTLSLTVQGLAFAGDAPAGCQPLHAVHAKVVAKADHGIGALRDYIFITRGMHQLDMTDVAASLDAWRAQARCAKAAAAQPGVLPAVAVQTKP